MMFLINLDEFNHFLSITLLIYLVFLLNVKKKFKVILNLDYQIKSIFKNFNDSKFKSNCFEFDTI
jgi:hypothetical protein